MEHLQLWAKTAQGQNFHPVVCHLLDTAEVCRRLLTLLPPAVLQRLQRGLGLDKDGLAAWVPFLAGSHDTGKVSPPFQFQDSEVLRVVKQLNQGSLYDLWSKRPKQLINDKTIPSHGTITACTLPEYLQKKCGIDEDAAHELAAIVGGHHGVIPRYEDIKKIIERPQFRQYNLGDSTNSPQWEQWRTDILEILADDCGIKNSKQVPKKPDAGAALLLAGITTLADWLASNQACFPAAGANVNLDTYINSLPAKVNATLEAAQWQQWQAHSEPLSFKDLFNNEPRGLQQAIENLMPNLRGKPVLLIVEAPTGEGKTEAALTVAHWHTSSGMPGTYIGMPTQATGNALYKRLKNYLNHWYPNQTINLQLVHSAASLDENFTTTICRFDNVYGDNPKLSAVAASEWFVHRKRALLAPWGVGTVDQALVGILRVKHQFLRLLGLAGKTVILDEVHAYDVYTSRLLDQLVHWCGILGSPVVILSATLSSQQRHRLLTSYAEGLGQQNPPLPNADYPRLTIYANGKAWIDPSFTRGQLSEINRKRDIQIRWIQESDINEYLGKGATAIIRSTVRRCQKTALRYSKLTDSEFLVFHSQFTQEHRQEKEQICEQRYGKPKSKDEPVRPPSLLVATQVIEQSLDVDFDILISDICPIDLLIQRIGRLWRHERQFRCVREPTIYLILPELDDNELPCFGQDVENHVYQRHVLLRTWYLLRDRSCITLPDDTDDLIEKVYNLQNSPAISLNQFQQKDWDESLRTYQKHQASLCQQAELALIPKLKGYNYAENLTNRALGVKDVEMLTRLIDDSMTVILDTAEGKVIHERTPKDNEILEVLRQQVRISSPGIIAALKKALKDGQIQIPQAWGNVPYLHDTPLLQVPIQVGNYSLSYCKRLGLRADKTTYS